MAGFFTKFFGRTASEGAAFALGIAVGPALSPAVRELENEAWSKFSTRPLDAGSAAEIVGERVALQGWGENEAAQTGVNTERFNLLVEAVRNAPDLATLYEAWQRELISDDDFEHGLRKARLEPRWFDALKALKQRLLSPENLAMMRQQGFVTRDRQIEESAKQGVNAERADLLFEVSGLPPGIETALEMLRRSIITEGEFAQIVREGHTKTKYTDELLALRHPVLSATQAATLRLKGWISDATANELGALTGYTPEQMERIYLSMGRPAAPGQMWTAATRGIDGPDGSPMDEAQFLKGIRQSDIRPEWGPMLWRIRYLYPSLFQLNRLVTSGVIDSDTGAKWAHNARYAPEVVTALRESWGSETTTTRDPHVVKAENQYWTTLHRSYVAEESDAATVEAGLDLLGVPQGNHARIVNLWNHERDLVRKQLTPAQIKKAYAKPVVNPATGANWTLDEALAALVERGYSLDDAKTFLEL